MSSKIDRLNSWIEIAPCGCFRYRVAVTHRRSQRENVVIPHDCKVDEFAA